MSRHERMAAVDAAWLHMDRPENVMNVTALLWFDEPVDWRRWEELVATRLVGRFPRMRQRVVESGLPLVSPAWEDDPDFDLSAHLHQRVLSAPNEQREMEKLVGGLMGASLRDFALNEVWLELSLIAQELMAWTKRLSLDGELARSEPKRLRHRLFHQAGRIARSGRRTRLRLERSWPWAQALVTAFERIKALPAPAPP